MTGGPMDGMKKRHLLLLALAILISLPWLALKWAVAKVKHHLSSRDTTD
jgi:hypothetical protein